MASNPSGKQRAFVIGLIFLGILIVGFFGLRAFHAFRKFHEHRPPPGQIETDVSLIRDWMTIPFISRMYYVPAKALFDALNIPPYGNDRKSLKDLNREYYPQESGIVMEKIQAAVLANQPPAPTATALPPPPPNPLLTP